MVAYIAECGLNGSIIIFFVKSFMNMYTENKYKN